MKCAFNPRRRRRTNITPLIPQHARPVRKRTPLERAVLLRELGTALNFVEEREGPDDGDLYELSWVREGLYRVIEYLEGRGK
jgi:hypothetical protein